jgi:hypothetical protein
MFAQREMHFSKLALLQQVFIAVMRVAETEPHYFGGTGAVVYALLVQHREINSTYVQQIELKSFTDFTYSSLALVSF